MLIEGTAIPAGDGSEDKEKRRRSKPAPPGVTRLQQYVAEPSPVAAPAPAAPAATTTTERAVLADATANLVGMPSYMVSPSEEETDERGALTVEEKAKTYRPRRAKEMSWDDYLGLSDRQRAAVDFNTMLVQARQKDLRKQDDYKPNEQQQEVYDKTVERLFGETGVSETFAPETVALLNDVGFQQTDAKRFNDLDDFLGLSAALTAKDIDKLGSLKPPDPVLSGGGMGNAMDLSLGGLAEPPPRPSETAADVATVLAAGSKELQESLTRGNQILENWKHISAGARNESLSFYGGLPNRIASPDIRLGQKDAEYFQMAYDALADATNGPEVLDLIRKDLGSDERMRKFLAYADTKSKYSQDQNVGLGGNPTVQYRSPDEFREILGLNKGGETGGTDRG